MRVLFSACLMFIFMNCTFSQFRSVNEADTVRFPEKTISINYRMLPGISRFEKRYRILTNVNDDYGNVVVSYSIQNQIDNSSFRDSSLSAAFRNLSGSYLPSSYPSTVSEKQLFFGIWRSRLTESNSESEIRQSVIDGTNTLIDLGYRSFGNDLLPFITGLMEEQHIVNYDNSRTKAFGKGSRGIVTSLEIINALGSQDGDRDAGVCRDVHETGRELLKTMSETWYGRLHPEKQVDFDDYIFLQSWMTNKSQHVTISLIDPLDTRKVYELDWGRVIERSNMPGYDNGRMYGNTYRIWKFDAAKRRSVPVDFRRTAFGKILDENILTSEEYTRFNGIYDQEFYSDARYINNTGKYGALSFSFGAYNPGQHYFLAGWNYTPGKRNLTRFLTHSGTFVLQGVIHEDTRKKQLLFPQIDWQIAASVMGIPRVISKFETSRLMLAQNFTVGAFMNQQFDIFLVGNSFYRNDSPDKNELSGSGDGNLSFSNGIDIKYLSNDKSLNSSFTLQARSFLMANDVRLFTPNVFTLIPNLCIVTPAVDAIGNAELRLNPRNSFSLNGMLSFTNLNAIVYSASASSVTRLSEDIQLTASFSSIGQVKGIEYFWYPVSRRWFDVKLSYLENSFAFSLLKYQQGRLSCNISFTRSL